MKVLLVDDSKSARFALRSMLGKKGLDVVMAESGEEALDVLKEHQVDLVLMDQSMPGMGGIEATRRIKTDPATADLPVVLCTSAEGEEFERKAAEAGAMTILSKPPAMAQLQQVISRLEQGDLAPPPAPAPAPAAEPAPAGAPAIDADGLKRQLESELTRWIQEIMDNSLEGINNDLHGLGKRMKDLEATQDDLRASLGKMPDRDTLKNELASLAEQQAGGVIETLQQKLAEQREVIDNLSAHVDNLPLPVNQNQALDELRLGLNQQIGELKDRQNGLLNEIGARVRAEVEESEQRLMRKVYTLVGLSFVVLAAAIGAVAFLF